jgi:hypothetical protein
MAGVCDFVAKQPFFLPKIILKLEIIEEISSFCEMNSFDNFKQVVWIYLKYLNKSCISQWSNLCLIVNVDIKICNVINQIKIVDNSFKKTC